MKLYTVSSKLLNSLVAFGNAPSSNFRSIYIYFKIKISHKKNHKLYQRTANVSSNLGLRKMSLGASLKHNVCFWWNQIAGERRYKKDFYSSLHPTDVFTIGFFKDECLVCQLVSDYSLYIFCLFFSDWYLFNFKII